MAADAPLEAKSTDGSWNQPERACTTSWELIRLNQQWSIANFSSLVKLCKPGQCLRSQSFCHPETPDVNWQLCMYPGGKREENKGYISLFLKMYAPPARDVCITAEYRLFFLADNGEKKFLNVNVGEFHSRSGKKGFGWGLRNLPRMKVLSCLRKDGSLLIHCEVDSLPDLSRATCVEVSCPLPPKRTLEVPSQYPEDLLSLLDSGKMSDFTITVDSVTFDVHRAILAGRSEVFCAMLNCSEMHEAASKSLDIEDSTPEAVRHMLVHMYAGRLDPSDLEGHVQELIGLAEKYSLPDLKSDCERCIAEHITVDTVFDAIALADLFSAQALKQACLNLILLNRRECLLQSNWTLVKSRRPKLAIDILEFLSGVASASPSIPGGQGNSSNSNSDGKPGLGEPPKKRLRLSCL